MGFKLKQILESTILLEGRKEDAIKKYGEEHTELINMLSDEDPSGNNKYLNWMVKTALGQNQDDQIPTTGLIIRTVNNFHKQLARIKNKDINSYKTLNDLKKAVDEALAKEEEKRIAKQAKKVFEDDKVVIYAPFTWEASCKYGAGSKWCVTMKDNPNYFNKTYGDDNFYFFLRKDVTKEDDPAGYKYALQVKKGDLNNVEWWNAEDVQTHGRTPNFVTPEMMDAVKEFNPVHKKIKLGAKAKAFLKNPNTEGYKLYSDMLTPEQRTKVIDDIISKGGLNSNDFSILVKDLTEKQINDFITNYVKGKVNTSDYKNMRNNLNTSQKLTLLKFNPSILNNYDVMKELDEEFTDEQKYGLSKVINSKLISNTDSKVLIKKWSMSPQERKKHSSTSFYVFISGPDQFIEKLVRVDPLDPESYRIINMLKLKEKVRSDINLYGIKTEMGVLDEYLGSSSDSMPEDVINSIKERVSKI